MLEISEARYRGIVISSGEAIIGTTKEGMIVSWNPSAERLYGFTESEAVTKTLNMLVPEESRGDIDALLKGITQGDCIRRREIKMRRKDSSIIDVMITICPMKGENKEIVGASSVVRDITQEKVEQHIPGTGGPVPHTCRRSQSRYLQEHGRSKGQVRVGKYCTSADSRLSDYGGSPWDRGCRCFF